MPASHRNVPRSRRHRCHQQQLLSCASRGCSAQETPSCDNPGCQHPVVLQSPFCARNEVFHAPLAAGRSSWVVRSCRAGGSGRVGLEQAGSEPAPCQHHLQEQHCQKREPQPCAGRIQTPARRPPRPSDCFGAAEGPRAAGERGGDGRTPGHPVHCSAGCPATPNLPPLTCVVALRARRHDDSSRDPAVEALHRLEKLGKEKEFVR